ADPDDEEPLHRRVRPRARPAAMRRLYRRRRFAKPMPIRLSPTRSGYGQVMERSHEMVCETETAAEVLFVCTDGGCGRRGVVAKPRPVFTVVARGDFEARHVGGLGGITMGAVGVA